MEQVLTGSWAGMGIAVSPRRSPRVVDQRGSFRQLLHDYYNAEHPALPAFSARRQSSGPATVAARSRFDVDRLECLFDPGLGDDSDDEQKDDAVNNEDEGDVYSEDGGDESDGDDSDRKSTSTAKTAAGGRTRRKSTGGKGSERRGATAAILAGANQMVTSRTARLHP
jgi:hypothetical protein